MKVKPIKGYPVTPVDSRQISWIDGRGWYTQSEDMPPKYLSITSPRTGVTRIFEYTATDVVEWPDSQNRMTNRYCDGMGIFVYATRQ